MTHIYSTDDISLLSVELTELFLATTCGSPNFQQFGNVANKQAWRLRALPRIQGYLQHDGLCGIQASALLFRTALAEEPLLTHYSSGENINGVLADFQQTPEFSRAFDNLIVHQDYRAEAKKEFLTHLKKHFTNILEGKDCKYNLFSNKLSHSDDQHNYLLLNQAAQDMYNFITVNQFDALEVLDRVLAYAHQCQQQLTNPRAEVDVERSSPKQRLEERRERQSSSALSSAPARTP